MSELDALMAQKRALEKRIRELKKKEISTHRCKFYLNHYTGSKQDEWTVSVKSTMPEEREERHYRIIACHDKTMMPALIQILIDNLTELKEKIEEEMSHGN